MPGPEPPRAARPGDALTSPTPQNKQGRNTARRIRPGAGRQGRKRQSLIAAGNSFLAPVRPGQR